MAQTIAYTSRTNQAITAQMYINAKMMMENNSLAAFFTALREQQGLFDAELDIADYIKAHETANKRNYEAHIALYQKAYNDTVRIRKAYMDRHNLDIAGYKERVKAEMLRIKRLPPSPTAWTPPED